LQPTGREGSHPVRCCGSPPSAGGGRGSQGTPNHALQQAAGHDSFWDFKVSGAPPLLRSIVRLKGDRAVKTCPYCTAEIPDEARKCKHCGEWVERPPPAPSESEAPLRVNVTSGARRWSEMTGLEKASLMIPCLFILCFLIAGIVVVVKFLL
jgi:hypothetical protein